MGLGDRMTGLAGRLRARRDRARHQAAFAASLRRIGGTPPDLTRRPDAVVVIAMVRDGMYHLADFLAHYRGLGAAHFIFCDTGSTDGTLQALAAERDCLILQTTMPFARIENDFRAHAALTYCRNAWALFADMDERLVYPGMEDHGLPALARALMARGQTALLAQMVEMFPEGPLAPWQDRPVTEVREAYRFFHPADITRIPYHDRDRIGFWYLLKDNRPGVADEAMLFGGVRARIFGEACCLTKHPLVQIRPPVQPATHPHCSGQVTLSPGMAALLHYKFTDDAFGRDAATVAGGGVGHGEDALRAARAANDPQVSLFTADAVAMTGTDALAQHGFVRAVPGLGDAPAPAGTVDAVVIGRNEGDRLRACLTSLQGSVRHIVYVDSGSTDGSADMARSLGARVVDLDLSRPFTAARARNAGLAALPPDADLVQLVDGDCEVEPGWIDAARAHLAAHPEIAVVCGRRRERHPGASLYNALADIEWNTPPGEAKACGGDALARVAALRQIGGFRDSLIAGEEPEMCLRLRQAGWRIWRLDAAMTIHDAAMTRFGQWWKRTRRAGHAFAEGAALHGRGPDRHWVAETRRALVWGAGLPLAIAVGALAWPPLLASVLIYPAQALRLSRRHGLAWGAFTTLGKFAEAQGVAEYRIRRALRAGPKLIEYK